MLMAQLLGVWSASVMALKSVSHVTALSHRPSSFQMSAGRSLGPGTLLFVIHWIAFLTSPGAMQGMDPVVALPWGIGDCKNLTLQISLKCYFQWARILCQSSRHWPSLSFTHAVFDVLGSPGSCWLLHTKHCFCSVNHRSADCQPCGTYRVLSDRAEGYAMCKHLLVIR